MFDFKQLSATFPSGANTELRVQKNTMKQASFIDGRLINNSSASSGGISARVYKNGSYGFASAPAYDNETAKEVLKNAETNAFFLDSKQKLGKSQFPCIESTQEMNRYTRDDDVEQKYMIDFCGKMDAHLAEKYPKLTSRSVVTNCLDMEKLLLTSDGVRAHSMTPRAAFYICMTMEDAEGNMQEIFEPIGDFGIFTELFVKPEDYYEKAEEIYSQLVDKCNGVYADAGIKECILHPDLAGMLAHEAVGHTTEADFVRSGSVAGPCLNKQVASELINLTDFANTAFGKRCPVPVYVDDEGVKAEDVHIIENGVLRHYMHNRESALDFGVAPTGNARAYSFSDEPLIRMRNTVIHPGTSKLDEMISSIKDGYYFIKTGNGQADSTGEFMFGVDAGYEIKNGKLGRAIKSTTISGVAFEMLKTVTMISDDLSWCCTGMCGKKQPIPVSMAGPAIKCKINVGGR